MKRPLLILIASCFILCNYVQGQSLSYLDSLEYRLLHTHVSHEERLTLLKQLADGHTEPPNKLSFSQKLIDLSIGLDSVRFIISGYLQKGAALRLVGDYSASLEALFKASEYAVSIDSKRDLGICYVGAADVYSTMNNHQDAINYYQKGIDILRSLNDSISLASALTNVGDGFSKTGQYDSALMYFQEAEQIFKNINYELGAAYNLGNIGLVYAQKGLTEQAESNMNKSISILERLRDYPPICIYLNELSDINREKGNLRLALKFAKESHELAHKYNLKQEISDASYRIFQIHELTSNDIEALNYYKQYVAYRDSVNNLASIQESARLRADFEISQKQLELDLVKETQEAQRMGMIASIIAAISTALLALGIFLRYRFMSRTNQIIQAEKNRSDELLLNILPAETARELKEKGKVKAKRFESVTVMFTDFERFTSYAEDIPPEQLVKSVDYYFSKFDDIIGKHGLEKIKTVGDAYLCVGGLPYPTEDHPTKMILAAKDILDVVQEAKELSDDIIPFNIRIGIHSGPVVAGVVGSKKFAYDIWGDTVNVASRMESNAESNRINISDSTYSFVHEKFETTYRGEVEIKNRSKIKMYYV